jgi:hypothetical protein
MFMETGRRNFLKIHSFSTVVEKIGTSKGEASLAQLVCAGCLPKRAIFEPAAQLN